MGGKKRKTLPEHVAEEYRAYKGREVKKFFPGHGTYTGEVRRGRRRRCRRRAARGVQRHAPLARRRARPRLPRPDRPAPAAAAAGQGS
jgi:hypothetical protein